MGGGGGFAPVAAGGHCGQRRRSRGQRGLRSLRRSLGGGGGGLRRRCRERNLKGGGYAASQAGRAHAPAQMQQQKRAEAIARAERGQRIAERASKACDQLVPAFQSIKHTRHKAHPLNCRANNHIIQLSRSARDCLGQWHLRPNGHCVAARVRENLLGSFRNGKSECGTEKGFDLILLISVGLF